MKKIFFQLTVLLFSLNLHAQDNVVAAENFPVALGISGSSNGIGVNVTTGLNSSFDLRLGYESINTTLPTFNFENDEVGFELIPNYKNGGFSAIVDWHFLRKMYLSGGVYFSKFALTTEARSTKSMEIGNTTYTPKEIGVLTVDFRPKNKVAPYLALGLGTNLPRFKHLGFSFELGAYFTGSYIVGVTGTKLFKDNSDPDQQNAITRVQDKFDGFWWKGVVPIVKIGFSYRLFDGLEL